MSEPNYYSMRKIFNVDVMRYLAYYGMHGYVDKWASHFQVSKPRDVYNRAYDSLLTNHPVEYVLKNELLKALRDKQEASYVRTEYWLNRNRVDVIEIGERSTAYEIKSRFDSPKRLAQQVKNYSKICEYVVLVTDDQSIKHFAKYVPSHVGQVAISSDGTLFEVRKPEKHTENLSKTVMLEQLNRDEKKKLIARLDSSKSTYHWRPNSRDLAKKLSTDDLNEHFKSLMLGCVNPKRYLRYVPELPHSFVAALYDYALTAGIIKNLIKIMNSDIPCIDRSINK